MPAVEHSFADAAPTHIYLDVDLVINYLVSTHPHHQRATFLLNAVRDQRSATIYASPMVWLEFVQVTKSQAFRSVLDQSTQARYRLHRWQQPLVRQAYVRAMQRILDSFFGEFGLVEIPLTREIRRGALALMARYNLDSHDAVHLASAESAGVFDFASFDEAFRRVDGLQLWNDLIHSPGA